MDLDVTLESLRRRQGGKWKSFDPDVIPAWVADMDFPVAEPIRQVMQEVLEGGDFGYESSASLKAFETAFVDRMVERFGWEPKPARIQPTGDIIQSMIAAVGAFCPAGDGVVIQTPIYYPFLDVVSMLGRRLVDNPLVLRNRRYEMDLDQLREIVDDGTRMVLFCNPHNPSGRVFERWELEGLAEIALEHDLIVVSDEVHADLAFEGHSHIPFASLGPEIAERTVTLTSATKAFNIAGLRCALIHFGASALRRRQSSSYHPRVLGVPNVFGIAATLAAWREGDEWLGAVVSQLDENRDRIARFLGEHLPAVGYIPPEASYLAWLDCSRLPLPTRPYDFFLEEAKVALSDGKKFGSRSEAFVRLNFATSPRVLEEILERMRDAVELG